MKRSEAYHILQNMYDEATEEQRAAISIAMDDIEFVDLMPDDMVAVVLCKDCKYRSPYFDSGKYCCTLWQCRCCGSADFVKPDGFCSYGERKDGE